MNGSLLIYIGAKDNETMDELAVSLQNRNQEVISSPVFGPVIGCASQELSEKITKRLKKQVYISCNVTDDRILRPLIEKRLVEEIVNFPQCF